MFLCFHPAQISLQQLELETEEWKPETENGKGQNLMQMNPWMLGYNLWLMTIFKPLYKDHTLNTPSKVQRPPLCKGHTVIMS